MPELIDKKRTEAKVFLIARLFIDRPDREVELVRAVIHRCCEEIDKQPTIEAEPVRHGRWIECDYKHMEHGVIETEPKAGLCCSECRTGFKKNRMTYKAFCPACGARMDASGTNIDLLCKINRGMLAGYECIMEVFVDEIDNSTVNIAERCGDYSANCEKCIADYLNDYPFCGAKSDGGGAE